MTGDRKKDFRNILLMAAITVSVYIFFGVSYMKEKPETWSELLMFWGFLIFLGIWTVADIVLYRKKYFEADEKDRTAEKLRRKHQKRKAKLKKSINGKDMYEVCSRFIEENNRDYGGLVAFIVILLEVFCFSWHIGRLYQFFCELLGMNSEGVFFWGAAICVAVLYIAPPILAGVGFYMYIKKGNRALNALKEAVAGCPYDKERVNDDFMHGSKHHLAQGLLHIGANYLVLCAKEASIICEVKEVLWAKKTVDVVRKVNKYGMKDEFQYYYIEFKTKDIAYKINCMDEMAVDLIVTDFEEHGIYTPIEQ